MLIGCVKEELRKLEDGCREGGLRGCVKRSTRLC